jgi:hypothetical protein
MPSPPLRHASAVASLTLPFVLAAAACGQVTGLSDDYVFDLDGSVTPGADSAVDASTRDAPSDASSSDVTDAAKTCSPAQIATAVQQMNAYNGATACKACLASACCSDVGTCSRASDCSRALDCKLDCTSRNFADRQQCFKDCSNSGSGVPASFTNGVGACAGSACVRECAFR